MRDAVIEAFLNKGMAGNVAKRTEGSELLLGWPRDRVDRARRVVSIGARDTTFGQPRYRDKLEAAASPPRPLARW